MRVRDVLAWFSMVAEMIAMAIFNRLPVKVQLQHRRGAITVGSVIMLVLGVYLLSYTLPEIITAIQAVNTSLWTFTGHTGAAAVWGLAGFIVVANFVRKIMAS